MEERFVVAFASILKVVVHVYSWYSKLAIGLQPKGNGIGSQMLIHRHCIGISLVNIAFVLQTLLPRAHGKIASQFVRCRSDGALALAGLLEEVGPLKLTGVVGLPVHCNAVESILESLAGAGVDHAGLGDISMRDSARDGVHALTPVASWLI
jgi:hypothetical protein